MAKKNIIIKRKKYIDILNVTACLFMNLKYSGDPSQLCQLLKNIFKYKMYNFKEE